MDLWNEYEGRTIAGHYPLERLLRPEGRSAFFSTSNGSGASTVIRLIESHYDDDEILARWQAVTGLKQDNLLALNKFGVATMDDTALVYAVLEPSEADLSQILAERALTVPEARELAVALVAALQALHSINLVHEHVVPSNILAVGETIKLRSDCIREAPEGPEGDQLRARDVHDLSLVLLHALTLDTNPGAPLASPFQEIIQHGLSGRWGLAEISQRLAATDPAKAAAPVATTPYSRPQSTPVSVANIPAPQPPVQAELLLAPAPTHSESAVPHQDRTYIPLEEDEPRGPRLPIATIGAVILIAVCFLLWHLAHRAPADQTANPAPAAQTDTAATQPVPTPAVAKPTPAATVRPANPNAGWRVVAFTYNRQDQAQAKADRLAHQHRDLHFEIFAPSGHAPWLVTVDGALTKEQALALQDKLRGRGGLPRDLYARNYARN